MVGQTNNNNKEATIVVKYSAYKNAAAAPVTPIRRSIKRPVPRPAPSHNWGCHFRAHERAGRSDLVKCFVPARTKVSCIFASWRQQLCPCTSSAPLCCSGRFSCLTSNTSDHATDSWKRRGTRALVTHMYSLHLSMLRQETDDMLKHTNVGFGTLQSAGAITNYEVCK